MKPIRYLAASAMVALLLVMIIANYSSTESSFECSGNLASKTGSLAATLYITLEEHRWWVGLWGDSNGTVRLEIPNRWVDYYDRVAEVGDQLQIFGREDLKGNFSSLSRTLALSTSEGFFDGVCRPND
jgi:hypothetical protein